MFLHSAEAHDGRQRFGIVNCNMKLCIPAFGQKCWASLFGLSSWPCILSFGVFDPVRVIFYPLSLGCENELYSGTI